MNITAAGVSIELNENFKLYRPNGRADYLFVLFKSPSIVVLDGEERFCDLGECIIFDRYYPQIYFPTDNKKFLHDFMHFDIENEYEEIILSEIPKNKLLRVSMIDGISGMILEIKRELNRSFVAHKKEILNNLSSVFWYRLKDEIENSALKAQNRTHFAELYNLRCDMYNEPWLNWSVDSMAQRVCLSRSYFQYLYKSFFAFSVADDVINARVAYAKVLLSTEPICISEIAEKCGYAYPEHFIRQFKSRVGVSPNKFRTRK